MDFIKSIDLLVFDFDGTLFHLDIDWKILKESLRPNDISIKLGDIIQEYVTSADYTNLDVITKLEIKGLKNKKLDNGIIRVLDLLSTQVDCIAIFTRNSRKVVELAIDGTIVQDKLQIIGREDVSHLKPNPEGLYRLMKDNNCVPEKTLLVGDTYHDIEAARMAGVSIIIVANDNNTYSPKGADYYINNLEELIKKD